MNGKEEFFYLTVAMFKKILLMSVYVIEATGKTEINSIIVTNSWTQGQ